MHQTSRFRRMEDLSIVDPREKGFGGGFDHAERGRLGDWDVMNEYIDSTVDLIPVYLLCSLLVTIRGLVGPFKWCKGRSSSLGTTSK
jgi:hypothetical protein